MSKVDARTKTSTMDDRITIRLPAGDEQALEAQPYPSVSLAVRAACHEYLTDQLEDNSLVPDGGRHDPLADADTSHRVTLRISSSLLEDIEDYATESNALHRSNVIRLAIRYLLRREDP